MKKWIVIFVALVMLCGLLGCKGNFGEVNLQGTQVIPEDGIIDRKLMEQLKSENAIAVFTGESNGLSYEWTIFGSDIQTPAQTNLLVELQLQQGEELKLRLLGKESFGFSALLSISLQERWNAQSATAYVGQSAVASVSLTGGKNTILNLSLDGSEKELVVRGDPLLKDAMMDGDADGTEAGNPETVVGTESVQDAYLSNSASSDSTVYTGVKDKYLTDPVPEGKPKPVEPEDQTVNASKSLSCTFAIDCTTILNNLDMLDPDKLEIVPSGGVILAKTTVTFYEGESVYDVLQRLCKDQGIHMEASWTPIYNSAYVEGIHNLYEFDCGSLSGWMYSVNGWYPNYGCSRYELKNGDVVQWRYTCDLGVDVGGSYAVGG